MKTLIFFLIFSLVSVCCALAATDLPQVAVKDKVITAQKNGKSVTLPEPAVALTPVKNSDLLFTGLSEDNSAATGLPVGLYLFDQAGALSAFLPVDYAEALMSVTLSPDQDVLVVDMGMSLNRDLFFFTYPDLKPINTTPVAFFDVNDLNKDKPSLVWINSKDILFNEMNFESERVCGYDPCGPVSVIRYNLAAGQAAMIFEGTAQCDYTVSAYADGLVTANELCLPSAEAWQNYPENAPEKKVTAKLP